MENPGCDEDIANCSSCALIGWIGCLSSCWGVCLFFWFFGSFFSRACVCYELQCVYVRVCKSVQEYCLLYMYTRGSTEKSKSCTATRAEEATTRRECDNEEKQEKDGG